MDPFKKRLIVLGGILVLSIVGIIVYRLVSGGGTTDGSIVKTPPKAVKLTWWGDLAPTDAEPLIAAYTAVHPYVSITYTQLDAKTGEQQLIEAWARNVGPDIYALRNEEIAHYASTGLITPMPATTVNYTYTKKKALGIKETLEIRKVERAAPSAETLRSTFVAGAFADMYQNGQILGFPLQFDSVAMFYNQQLLDEAGILTPMANWDSFVQLIPKLTLTDDAGELVRAGVSMGRSINVPRNAEIFTALFRSYNIELTDPGKTQVTFATDKNAANALALLTSFATPTKKTYTWNETFPSSLDALAQGKVAIAFGTAKDYADVTGRTTGADIRVATFPQGFQKRYVADYTVHTVAKKTADANVAWDFLRFAADPTQAKTLAASSGRTPAIRALIEEQLAAETETAGAKIFAQQAATAEGWFPGINPEQGRNALNALVDDVATSKATTVEALTRAAQLFTLSLGKAN